MTTTARRRYTDDLNRRIWSATRPAQEADREAAIDYRPDPDGQPHRGSEFIWAAGMELALGNPDRGFLLAHKALEHDEHANDEPRSNQPAFRTATLNPASNCLGPLIETLRRYLRERCGVDERSFTDAMTRLLRCKDDPPLDAAVYALSQTIARAAATVDLLEDDERADARATDAACPRGSSSASLADRNFRPVMAGRLLNEQCIALESVVKVLHPELGKKSGRRRLFNRAAAHLVGVPDETLNQFDEQAHDNPALLLDDDALRELLRAAGAHDEARLDLRIDALRAWAIRNHFSHNASPIPGLHRRFSEFMGSVLRTVIAVVDTPAKA